MRNSLVGGIFSSSYSGTHSDSNVGYASTVAK